MGFCSICPDCGASAHVNKTHWIVPGQLAYMYCLCKNPECRSRYTMQIERFRLLQPSATMASRLLRSALDSTVGSERQEAIATLKTAQR